MRFCFECPVAVRGPEIRSAGAATQAAHFRYAWRSGAFLAPVLAAFQSAVDARPLAALGTSSLVKPPWLREPLAAKLLETRGLGPLEVEAGVVAAVPWPVQGTSMRALVEAALRPEFSVGGISLQRLDGERADGQIALRVRLRLDRAGRPTPLDCPTLRRAAA